MSGHLKLSGDLTKAMALEGALKAIREARSFHTMAARYNAADAPPATYENVPQVGHKNRMKITGTGFW